MTLRSVCLSCALVLFGSASVAACGSDDSPHQQASPFSSGVQGTKTFDTLTDADVSNLCAKLSQYILTDTGLTQAACHFAGFGTALGASLFGTATDADLQKTCADIEARCLQTPPTVTQETCNKPPTSCTATVGEFEACVTDSLAEAVRAFSALPACSSITSSSLQKLISAGGGGAMTPVPEPASCTTLEQKCPGIRDSTGLSSVTDKSSSGM